MSTYTPGTRVTTPHGPGVIVQESPQSPHTALISLEDTPKTTYRRYRFDQLTPAPKETPTATYTPGLIAARAINAHPWLDVVYPEPGDTDVLITPPWPATPADSPSGHIEGRATWNTTSNGTVNYYVTLAYDGPDDTVEDEITVEITPGPLAWLDLARPIAELMGRLHSDAHALAAA